MQKQFNQNGIIKLKVILNGDKYLIRSYFNVAIGIHFNLSVTAIAKSFIECR